MLQNVQTGALGESTTDEEVSRSNQDEQVEDLQQYEQREESECCNW